MIRHRYITLLAVILSTIAVHAASSANAVVEKCISAFQSATSMTMRYTLTVDGAEPSSGIMCIRGEKFKINSVPVAVWYDGTTQWTYTADTKEVTIVEPTPEEIADINPFAIINGFRRGCEAKLVSSDKASDTVTLTPLSKASTVRQATITFSKASSLPTHIEIQLRAGGQMSLTITSANPNINYPASTFVFDKNKYPKATVVDLR